MLSFTDLGTSFAPLDLDLSRKRVCYVGSSLLAVTFIEVSALSPLAFATSLPTSMLGYNAPAVSSSAALLA